MIKAIRANVASFKSVRFEDGFNVVIADRTTTSEKKDSRNGLGKTTLIEIIHFCLGGQGAALKVPELAGWEFELEFTVRDQEVRVWRSIDKPATVSVEADTTRWPVQPSRKAGGDVFGINAWNDVLGWLLFGLQPGREQKYEPTFRSLVSYFIRNGRDAFSLPFVHHRKQQEWDKQVNTAFLLGLEHEDATKWQVLRDKEKLLGALKQAAQTGVMAGMLGSLGELEAERVRLESEIAASETRLQTFQVHPEYQQVREKANRLTEEIHTLANENVADDRLATFYEESGREERGPEREDLKAVYESAGVALPGVVLRRFEEVDAFHHTLIQNRRSFLAGEIGRLRRRISEREEAINRKSNERAEFLRVLQTHGALEEYTELQRAHLGLVARLKDLETRIGNLRNFERGKSAAKIEREVLQQEARRDHDERRPIRERSIALFNENSEALYRAPGRLVIDVGPSGFKFDVDIQRSGSQGVSSMKVFCYDLMLAQLWSNRSPSPRLLVHDSTIFDGVDERQVALALARAAEESHRRGFQYICTMNSDSVPTGEFPEGFDLTPYIRLRLTDATESGGLLGLRF